METCKLTQPIGRGSQSQPQKDKKGGSVTKKELNLLKQFLGFSGGQK